MTDEGEFKKRSFKFGDPVYSSLVVLMTDIEKARREFLEIYPEEYVGGSLKDWIKTLEGLIEVTKSTAKRMQVSYRQDEEKLLETLKWFLKWFGGETKE